MSNSSYQYPDKPSTPAIRAYLGGSFDPVHNGHVQMALSVYQHLLPLAEQEARTLQVSLLPNARSPFKTNSTDPKHRLAMLKLATQSTPIQISELELWQAPPVYTIDSVRALRQRYPNDCLIFVMGMDSAHSLTKWKDGLMLTDYVHLWVFDRDSAPRLNDKLMAQNIASSSFSEPSELSLPLPLPLPLHSLITDSPTKLIARAPHTLASSHILKNHHQGRIYIDLRPVAAISSTQIRQQLQKALIRLPMTPTAKAQIACAAPINAIISNTDTNLLAKWLNPAVYHYIIAHQLYSAAQFR